MSETQRLFPTTRTERRIQRLGIQPWALTPAAVELVARRHRTDVLAAWAVAVPGLAGYVIACWPRLSFPDHPTDELSRRYALLTGGATAFYEAMTLLASAVKRHLDRLLAAAPAVSPLMFLVIVSNGGLLALHAPLSLSARPWPEPAPWLAQPVRPTT